MGDKEKKKEREKQKSESRSGVPALWDPFEELDLLERWSPFRELGWLSPRLARRLESRLGGIGERGWLPAMDVEESDEGYVITVELPGASRDDLTVETRDNVMTIRGEKRSESEEKKQRRRWVERTYGSFSRSFTLPSNAAADRVEASFEDGVLTLRIPKREEAKPKVVSIRSR